jgi:hypothetical protein
MLDSDILISDKYLQDWEPLGRFIGPSVINVCGLCEGVEPRLNGDHASGVDTGAQTLDRLRSYPGRGDDVIRTLEKLRLDVILPAVVPSGVYTEGVDIPPGTYVTQNVSDRYWERLDSSGEIIDNNFINAAPRAQVTIRSSDLAFNTERCGTWRQQL